MANPLAQIVDAVTGNGAAPEPVTRQFVGNVIEPARPTWGMYHDISFATYDGFDPIHRTRAVAPMGTPTIGAMSETASTNWVAEASKTPFYTLPSAFRTREGGVAWGKYENVLRDAYDAVAARLFINMKEAHNGVLPLPQSGKYGLNAAVIDRELVVVGSEWYYAQLIEFLQDRINRLALPSDIQYEPVGQGIIKDQGAGLQRPTQHTVVDDMRMKMRHHVIELDILMRRRSALESMEAYALQRLREVATAHSPRTWTIADDLAFGAAQADGSVGSKTPDPTPPEPMDGFASLPAKLLGHFSRSTPNVLVGDPNKGKHLEKLKAHIMYTLFKWVRHERVGAVSGPLHYHPVVPSHFRPLVRSLKDFIQPRLNLGGTSTYLHPVRNRAVDGGVYMPTAIIGRGDDHSQWLPAMMTEPLTTTEIPVVEGRMKTDSAGHGKGTHYRQMPSIDSLGHWDEITGERWLFLEFPVGKGDWGWFEYLLQNVRNPVNKPGGAVDVTPFYGLKVRASFAILGRPGVGLGLVETTAPVAGAVQAGGALEEPKPRGKDGEVLRTLERQSEVLDLKTQVLKEGDASDTGPHSSGTKIMPEKSIDPGTAAKSAVDAARTSDEPKT